MPRYLPSPWNLFAAMCMVVGLPAHAQSYPDPLQEVSKCVRGGEVFYTNGECPKGARNLKLGGDPMPEPRRTSSNTPSRKASPEAFSSNPYSHADSGGFRPLNSFPRLPEESMERSADTRPELREAPVRATGRPIEHTPVPDTQANNQVMCGFVAAELSRLATEAAAATEEANKTRIATHQKRLNERAEQLKCPA